MKRVWKELREYIGAVVIVFLILTFGFTTVGVAGESMEPTLYGGTGELPQSLLVGDRVFVPKYQTWLRRLGWMPGYERGDIVVVRELADSPLESGGETSSSSASSGCLVTRSRAVRGGSSSTASASISALSRVCLWGARASANRG